MSDFDPDRAATLLRALAREMRATPPERWPDLVDEVAEVVRYELVPPTPAAPRWTSCDDPATCECPPHRHHREALAAHARWTWRAEEQAAAPPAAPPASGYTDATRVYRRERALTDADRTYLAGVAERARAPAVARPDPLAAIDRRLDAMLATSGGKPLAPMFATTPAAFVEAAAALLVVRWEVAGGADADFVAACDAARRPFHDAAGVPMSVAWAPPDWATAVRLVEAVRRATTKGDETR